MLDGMSGAVPGESNEPGEPVLTSVHWYYMTGAADSAQTHGPFNADVMKGLFTEGYITEDALVWTPGQADWLPLKACHDLYSKLVFDDDAKTAARPDQELAQFNAQIEALEGGKDALASPAAADDVDAEEAEFVDDDGTRFVWDAALKKFVPDELATAVQSAGVVTGQVAEPGGAPPMRAVPGAAVEGSALDRAAERAAASHAAREEVSVPAYTAEMMRFEADEERVPTLAEAQAEEAAAVAAADSEAPEAGAPPSSPKRHLVGSKRPAAVMEAASDGRGGLRGSTAQPKQDSVATERTGPTSNNTSVYVTGIPDDATEDEVAAEFARCGIIRTDDNGSPRVKLYRDKATGMLKGDALVVFLQRPSVALAVKLMHDRPLRPGRGTRMTVQEAQFQERAERGGSTAVVPGHRSAAPSMKAAKPKGHVKGGKGKRVEKALGWGGFDDAYKAEEVTVVLTNVFTAEEMTLSTDLEPALQAYALDMCKSFGAIDAVRVHRKNAAGAVSLRFRTPEAADAAVARMRCVIVIAHMFAANAVTLQPSLASEIRDDVVLKLEQLGLGRALLQAAGAPVIRVFAPSMTGSVAVAFDAIEAAHEAVLAFTGLSYDGRLLAARAVGASLWDGKTPLATFGVGERAGDDDAVRLERYAQELEAS